MAEGFIVRKGSGGAEPIAFDTGPGPTELVAGDYNAGFFGLTTQTDFGGTMSQVMTDLGITQGIAQFTTDPLLKFIHKGKIKYINQKPIRRSISWDHIQARLSGATVSNTIATGNVYAGAILTIGGRKYRVRLMRGWGQVFANTNKTGAPNYNSGPLMTSVYINPYDTDPPPSILFTQSSYFGNWPANDSPWNAASPNEWNTLMFPISVDSGTQYQTANTPNWANYSNADLIVGSGNGKATLVQETKNDETSRRIHRGSYGIAYIYHTAPNSTNSVNGLRLVFELI